MRKAAFSHRGKGRTASYYCTITSHKMTAHVHVSLSYPSSLAQAFHPLLCGSRPFTQK